MNKCPKCGGLDSLVIVNYNSYTDTFIYRCDCCGFSDTFRYNEYVNYTGTYNTDKSIVNNKLGG